MELTQQEQKTIYQKWAVHILFVLYGKQKMSYRKIKNMLNIPTSTLSLRLNQLIRYKFIEKFVYGNSRGPHYVEYQITDFGMKYLNSFLMKDVS